MRGDLLKAKFHRPDFLFVDARAIARLGHVGFGLGQTRQKYRLEGRAFLAEEIARQLQHARRIRDDLHGLNARNVVEKPAAAGVHQLRVPLHLHQLQRADTFVGAQWMALVFKKKARDRLHRCDRESRRMYPSRAFHTFVEKLLTLYSVRIATASRNSSRASRKRRAPFLVEARLSAVASAIRTPALHAVRATPRCVVDDLALGLRRKLRQKIP